MAPNEGDYLERARAELVQIRTILNELLALPCMWSEVVFACNDPRFRGIVVENDIFLNCDFLNLAVRWRILIHELLHTYSSGNQIQYCLTYPGWEEGVVERVQQLLRPQILAQLGVSLTAAEIESIEKQQTDHHYSIYVHALEGIRALLQREDTIPFYLELLATPLYDRASALLRCHRKLNGEKYLEAFLNFNYILNSRVAVHQFSPEI